jgi:hypothetical protein
MPQVGQVTTGPGLGLSCPTSSNFLDAFHGLYGPGTYPITSPLCLSSDPQLDQVLVSTLSFTCVVCTVGTYSVRAGGSSGAPRQATNFPCLTCPRGATCVDGLPLATVGYWGASDPATGVVTFALCPSGYCLGSSPQGNSSSSSSSSSTVNTCAGQRGGALCADCGPGFVEGVGSPLCVHLSACSKEMPGVWATIVVAILGLALVQLTCVSGVWLPSHTAPAGKARRVVLQLLPVHGFPTAKTKLALYFFQVAWHVHTDDHTCHSTRTRTRMITRSPHAHTAATDCRQVGLRYTRLPRTRWCMGHHLRPPPPSSISLVHVYRP